MKHIKLIAIFLSVVLAVSICASSLTAFAADDDTYTVDGNTVYIEEPSISNSDLYSIVSGRYTDADLESKAESGFLSSLEGFSGLANLKYDYNTEVDKSSIQYWFDGNELTADDDGETPVASNSEHTFGVKFSYTSTITFEKKPSDWRGKILLGLLKAADYEFSNGDTVGTKTDTLNKETDGTLTFVVSIRTVTSLENNSYTYTYGSATEEEILAALNPSVVVKNTDEPIIPAEFEIVENLADVGAGTKTITVKFKGGESDNGIYQPSTAEATVIVKKAPASLVVNDQTVVYSGNKNPVDIQVTPEGLSYVCFTIGVEGDATGYAAIDVAGNSIIDFITGLAENPIAGAILDGIGNRIGKDVRGFLNGEVGLTLEEVKTVVSALGESGLVGDTANIDGILNTIGQVAEKLPDLNVKFYFGSAPINTGLYWTFAVTTNGNYETAMDSGTIIITPDFNVQLQWNQEIGYIISNATDMSTLDFTAKLTEKDAEAVGVPAEEINANIHYVIWGYSYDGDDFYSTDPTIYPTKPGVYNETASVLYNYVAAATRSFAIERKDAFVKFVDENGNYVDTVTRKGSYTGEPDTYAVKAVVIDAAGNEIEGVNAKITYTGIDKNIKWYLSSDAPTIAGSYTATASFAGNDLYKAASSKDGKITITRKDASITFSSITTKIGKSVDYSTVICTGYTGLTEEEAAEIAKTIGCGSSSHLLIGIHKMSVTIPEDIANNYNVKVIGGYHTVKLF